MVEAAPQLVDAFSCNQGETDGQVGYDPDLVDRFSGLRVIIGAESIRVSLAERLDKTFKLADVVFGPFDFRPDAEKSV
jgi:hypothetical protein